jgi:hypothetical protein
MNVQDMPFFLTITQHPLSRLPNNKEHCAHQSTNAKNCCQCLGGQDMELYP